MTTTEAMDRATGAARSIRNGVDDATSKAHDAAEAAPEVIERLRETVEVVADRIPDALETARKGALATAGSLRAMPQPTLQMMAALSLGMGLGLYVAGAPRLLTVVAFSPALLVGILATVDQARPASKRS
jgi:hypothetical protein